MSADSLQWLRKSPNSAETSQCETATADFCRRVCCKVHSWPSWLSSVEMAKPPTAASCLQVSAAFLAVGQEIKWKVECSMARLVQARTKLMLRQGCWNMTVWVQRAWGDRYIIVIYSITQKKTSQRHYSMIRPDAIDLKLRHLIKLFERSKTKKNAILINPSFWMIWSAHAGTPFVLPLIGTSWSVQCGREQMDRFFHFSHRDKQTVSRAVRSRPVHCHHRFNNTQ